MRKWLNVSISSDGTLVAIGAWDVRVYQYTPTGVSSLLMVITQCCYTGWQEAIDLAGRVMSYSGTICLGCR